MQNGKVVVLVDIPVGVQIVNIDIQFGIMKKIIGDQLDLSLKKMLNILLNLLML